MVTFAPEEGCRDKLVSQNYRKGKFVKKKKKIRSNWSRKVGVGERNWRNVKFFIFPVKVYIISIFLQTFLMWMKVYVISTKAYIPQWKCVNWMTVCAVLTKVYVPAKLFISLWKFICPLTESYVFSVNIYIMSPKVYIKSVKVFDISLKRLCYLANSSYYLTESFLSHW